MEAVRRARGGAGSVHLDVTEKRRVLAECGLLDVGDLDPFDTTSALTSCCATGWPRSRSRSAGGRLDVWYLG
jgi:hypothetical protein